MTCSYDLRRATRAEVLPLFEAHHGYKSLSSSLTYCFAVFEDARPVAAYVWQPPPPQAAKSTCPEAPGGVLSLSRMVAVPRAERRLNHVSKPLRQQMRILIDRTRWPVLITYSDEGQGHTGHVYRCSGWEKTSRAARPVFEDAEGRRCSSYSNGKHGRRELVRAGSTTIQRWEHWVCPRGEALAWMTTHGWKLVEVPGKTWVSGAPARTWVKDPARSAG